MEPVYLYAKLGKRPEVENSNVRPTAVGFLKDRGDLLLSCEVNTSLMRLPLLEGPDYGVAEENRVIAEDCMFDIARAPDGTIYYGRSPRLPNLQQLHIKD